MWYHTGAYVVTHTCLCSHLYSFSRVFYLLWPCTWCWTSHQAERIARDMFSKSMRQRRSGTQRAAMMLTASFFLGTSLAPAVAHAQSVTFAGRQRSVPVSGIGFPGGVAMDATGDLFVADNIGVVKVPAGGGAPTTLANMVTGFGMTADAAGNLFVVDVSSLPHAVKEIPAKGGSPVTIPTSGLKSPIALAVDSAGNLFIADEAGTVAELPAGGGPQITLANNLAGPFGIALDKAGNLFVALAIGGSVVELPAGGGAPITLAKGLASPIDAAVDRAGNLFVIEQGGSRVLEFPAGGGAPFSLGSGFSRPVGIVLDQSGNLFIADIDLGVMVIQPTSANFGPVNLCPAGQTTPAPCSQVLTLNYDVTAGGSLGPIRVVTGGAQNKDFTLASGSSCTGAVTAGTPCTVNVNFTPLAAGARNGAVQLTDSSGNVLASTLIYGVGLGPQITFGAGAQAVLDTALSDPYNVAVDGSGNVFVADTLNARVMKIPAGGGTPTSIVSGLSFPTGAAGNGAGDLLIVDNATALLVEVPAGGGTPINVPIQLTSPVGVAVDGAGNVFISSFNGQSV